MSFKYLYQQSIFVLRTRYIKKFRGLLRRQLLVAAGMKIAKGCEIPKLHVTWPHQVTIGKNCILEHDIYFKYDGIWSPDSSIIIEDDVFIGSGCEFNISGRIQIGKRAMIASGCKFIDHDHGTKLNMPMNFQPPIIKSIFIGEQCWLGVNVIVLKGVKVGDGAIIGAGSLLLRDVGVNEIWGGVPAKLIGKRSYNFK